ncbi:DNA-dependent metalloprotease dvc-1 [Linepithema humile]|uniref:DNA-dependent metalloprotease dvc-1 n=1 Tax=Linepithema humile TaxID=83485 RepID=UPI00062310D5|nr:PREDICTED: sprT-like domain-containing protein Spartan [Linepithema humile]
MASQKTQDFHVAYDMHGLNRMGVAEKENAFHICLVDKALELIDPTPNIYKLFVQFNATFFWNVLSPVEVKWSKRMTSCAGICSFHRRNKHCIISLSAPLLILRPRKDLVETLLHEMIHAYLFLTNNDRDRDGHGPNFCKHMNRINKKAGTNITIYHNFHNEVKLYKQHWWQCNGPCRYKPPFFGTVRRAMNRAPGPSDFWWREHEVNCGGHFIKIKEPENFKSRPKQSEKSKSILKNKKPNRNISDWLTNTPINAAKPTSSKVFTQNDFKLFTQTNNDKPSSSKESNGSTNSSRAVNENTQDFLLGWKQVGTLGSNASHYWAGSGPKVEKDKPSKSLTFSCSGVLGGSSSGRSSLLKKFPLVNEEKRNSRRPESSGNDLPSESARQLLHTRHPVLNQQNQQNQQRQPRTAFCPICNVPMENIYRHIDSCLINATSLVDELNNNINNNNNNNELMLPFTNEEEPTLPMLSLPPTDVDIPNKRLKSDDSSDTADYVSCPVCSRMITSANINEHLDECLLEADTARKAAIPSTSRASYDDNVINISSSSNSDLSDSILVESTTPQPCASTSTDKSDTTDVEQKCLVCNARIAPEVSLNEHLEECIGSVFSDDNMIIKDDENDKNDKNDDDDDDDDDEDKDNDNDDALAIENNSKENKYPCPVCMQIISENLMNQHLDMCLENE